MKIAEMKPEITYILCPDPSCKLFFKPNCHIPCEYECPKQLEMKKLVFCPICKTAIELDGNHSSMMRVDCNCGASLFYRMTGKYHLIYERPEK